LDLTVSECCLVEGSGANGAESSDSVTLFVDGLRSKPLVILGRLMIGSAD
jgi:hypothetical protein